jgi:hypothetical protein
LLSCKFPFNYLFYYNHCYCLFSLLVLLLLPSCSLICSATLLSIALCCIMIKHSFEVTTWFYE